MKKLKVQYKITALVDLFYTTGAVKIEKVAELGKLADTKQSLLNEFPFAYNFKISTDRVEVYQWRNIVTRLQEIICKHIK